MDRKCIPALVAATLGALAAAPALAQSWRDTTVYHIARAPDWNPGSVEGSCRLRVYVDDRARVELRGDQIIVRTQSGRRSFDQGTVCNQPLPFQNVDDFRVTVARGRGEILDVTPPSRRNNFAGGFTIDDPQNGAEDYELVVAWRNPATRVVPSVAASDPFPYFDETRACQDRVRGEFYSRNRDGDAYLEFGGMATRDEVGPNRERIRGEGWARNRIESRPITYECVINDRTNRVITSSYDVRPRNRYSSLY